MKAAFWIYPTKIKILLECQRAATLPEAQCVTRLSFARASGRVRWKASWFSLWFTLWRYPVKNKEIMRRGKNKSAAEILSASWKQLVKPQSLFWTGKWLKKTQLWLWACSNNLPPTCRRTRGQASLHTSLLSLPDTETSLQTHPHCYLESPAKLNSMIQISFLFLIFSPHGVKKQPFFFFKPLTGEPFAGFSPSENMW